MKLNLDSEKLMSGRIVATPPGKGEGFWAGAPYVYHDDSTGKFYMTYRIRRPRGGDPATERGGESRIAVSSNGFDFEDIWSVKKPEYGTSSIEKSSLYRDDGGRWRYFTSFVNPEDGRWCTAATDAATVEGIDPSSIEILFSATDHGLEGVKDPWIYQEAGTYYMFLSVALATDSTSADSHASHDIYNTGECVAATALATSTDLIDWEWQGVVLRPDTGWDSYCRRLNSVLKISGGYLGFYDGIGSYRDNYEEKTGLAFSRDLHDWQVVPASGPTFASPHGRNALRYLTTCRAGDRLLMYYETSALDLSHDLRALSVDEEKLIGEPESVV